MQWFAVAGLVPALLAVAPGAPAEPSGSVPGPETVLTDGALTESEFLAVLDGDHPAVREAAQGVALVRAEGLARSAFASPQIHFDREDPSGPGGQTDWAVSWQLPDPRRRLDLASHDQSLRAAEAQFVDDRRGLRFQMRAVYARWALAVARGNRLREQLDRVEALVRRQEERTRKGEASGLDTHRLVLAATDLRTRLALAEQERAGARAVVLGWYPDLSSTARPVLTLPSPLVIPEGDSARPPRIEAAEAELEAQKLARRAAQRVLRSPDISAGWLRSGRGEAASDGVSFGLSWTLPVGGDRRARRAAAEARRDLARARLDSTVRWVESEQRAARESFDLLATAHGESMELQQRNHGMLAAMERSFELGESPLTDLLDLLDAVTSLDLAILDLHGRLLEAHRRYEALTAQPTPNPESKIHEEPNP